MPLKTCNVDGKSGYKWGDQGKCYTGPGAKNKALKQGVAIEGPEKFSQYMRNKGEELSLAEIKEIVNFMHAEGYSISAITATTLTLQKIRAPKDGKMGADGYYVHMKKNPDKSKKDSKKDAKGKTKKEWDKIDREELKRDTKKEKKEHEKDAVKDDKEKIKKLKKGDPSEKKRSEIKDLEKDKRYDKRSAKSDSDRRRHERLDRDEDRQDKRELDSETLRQRLQHHKDAIKNLEKEIRDLQKDKKEDEKDVKEESKGAKLTTKQVNDLPDSDFAYIAPGGKVVDGKTEPRSLRHLPIPDAAHVRNALARLSQTHIPETAKKSALRKIKSRAKKFGVDVSE